MRTIKRGIIEIKEWNFVRDERRIREIGGGRHAVIENNPELLLIEEEILEMPLMVVKKMNSYIKIYL